MRKTFFRLGTPVVFLAAVTVVVVIARSALHNGPLATAVASPTPRQAVATLKQPARRTYYRLQPGDTIDVVAQRFHTTVHQLLLFNPGIHPDALAPGQKLRVR